MTDKSLTLKDWLDELRSGRRKQTTGALCDDDGMCCLGVLRVILVGEPSYDAESDYWIYPDGRDGDEEDLANRDLADLAKRGLPLHSAMGCPRPEYRMREVETLHPRQVAALHDPAQNLFAPLAYLNDGGWTFKQIADLLEAYPHVYVRQAENDSLRTEKRE